MNGESSTVAREVARQVPALLVFAYITIQGMGYLKERDQLTERIWDEVHTMHREALTVISVDMELRGQMVIVLENVNHVLERVEKNLDGG